MTDQLEEMFARARTETLSSVRPPGADAARRTVRRRRTGTVTAVVATVAAAGGVLALVQGPSAAPPQPAASPPAPSATSAIAVRTEVARAALLRGLPDTAAVQDAGPVYADYLRRQEVYLPVLTLRVACAGAGRITVLVQGRPVQDPKGRGEPAELARVPVVCGPSPIVVEREFAATSDITSEVVIRLTDVASAAGRASFAFRVTGPATIPDVDPGDPANSPVTALERPGELMRHASAGQIEKSGDWRQDGDVPVVAGKRYTLAGACAGTGTLRLAVRPDNGTVLRELSVPCSWPPSRHDVDLGELDRRVYIWAHYESAQPAQIAWSMIES